MLLRTGRRQGSCQAQAATQAAHRPSEGCLGVSHEGGRQHVNVPVDTPNMALSEP